MSLNRQERRRAERIAAKAAAKASRSVHGTRDVVTQARQLLDAGGLKEAEQVLRAVVDVNPTDGPALVLLSHVLLRQRHLDEAAAVARRATVSDPGSAAAQTALGDALREQDRVFEALQCHDRAVSAAPDDAEAHHSYGLSLLDAGDPSLAAEHLRRACELSPRSVRYITSLATALTSLNKYAEALEIFDDALEVLPENPQLRFNRSFCLLATGRLAEGWDDFEYGFPAQGRKPDRTFAVPRWSGAPLAPGERLLVWREQGIGDELRLASCYREVIEHLPDVIIEAEPRLVGMFRRSFPTATVRTPTCDDDGAPTRDPDFHAHIAAGSLPGVFRRSLEDFPAEGRYLVADPRRIDEFRQRLDDLGPGLKVGICWRSMKLDVKRLQWYTTLEEWGPVFDVPDVKFVNLQYGDPELLDSELRAHEARTSVPVAVWDDVDYTNDMESVAALISALDLVVGVSTSVSLLGGALGKPVVQLGLAGDPMQFGLVDTYPWFPTVVPLERQPGQTWAPVMEKAAGHVRDAAARR